jgi:RHS repeat-associated protein
LGSVRWVTDGSGNLVASYVYEGFGKIVGQSGGGGGPYQFCGLWGYRNDQDAGLLHVGARYYEVETGRWVQKDLIMGSILYPLSLNGYSYVVNNPILFVDPQGLTGWATLICFVLGTIIGAIIGGGVGAATGAAIGLLIGGTIDAIITYYSIKPEVEKLESLIEKQEKSAGVDVERVYEKR